MARRIEIELTSARSDGTWTWRAAGALQPRGILDGKLLHDGAKAGDVVRADAEFEVEGITIVGILAPKDKKRPEPDRLEVIGPPRAAAPGVTTTLTSRGHDDGGSSRGPRRTGEGAGGRNGRSTTPRADRPAPERTGRPPADRSTRPPGERSGRPATDRPARPAGDRPARASGERTPRPTGGERTPRPGRTTPVLAGAAADGTGARPRGRKLNPGNVHRSAVLESLPPEHRPIAEQVLRGGIPAVRTAIHLEGEKAAAEGRPAPNSDALLGIAEELLPRLKAADWRDRADAAEKLAEELPLRDLRSVVDGAQAARDDESRHLAAHLREVLERRAEALRVAWLDEIRANLAEMRLVRALRLSSRPPDASTRLPADLAAQLAEAAGQAMSADTPAERWEALLEAVAASPVRRAVKPGGLPAVHGEDLLRAARQQSGRVPALATMLGISMPPPPGPIRRAASPTS